MYFWWRTGRKKTQLIHHPCHISASLFQRLWLSKEYLPPIPPGAFVPFPVHRGTCSTIWAVPLHHLTAASFAFLRPIEKQLHKCKLHEPSLFLLLVLVFPCQADKTAYFIKNAVQYQEKKVLLADFPRAATIRANYKALTLTVSSFSCGWHSMCDVLLGSISFRETNGVVLFCNRDARYCSSAQIPTDYQSRFLVLIVRSAWRRPFFCLFVCLIEQEILPPSEKEWQRCT